jgi:NADPH-dependent curcumin reductase CurA
MELQVVQKPGPGIPWTRYFTVLGAVGFCAFAGFEGLADAKQVSVKVLMPSCPASDIGRFFQGDTIFVSSGASSVGR